MGQAFKNRLAIGILAFWLASVALAFWWFQARLIQPFTEDFAPFTELATSPTPLVENNSDGITVVQLVDEACYCSRVNQDHRDRIRQRYAGSPVVFIEAQAGQEMPASLAQHLPQALEQTKSPAALVINKHGRLEYFGPYSFGAGCFTGTGTYVERAIDRALANESHPQVNVLGTGCFCDWRIIT